MSEQRIRTFIAIKVPDEVRESLRQTSGVLQKSLPRNSVRWVKPESIHLTLRFLGDTPMEWLPTICEKLDEVANQFSPMVLQLEHLGCFPNPRRPRVIWVGLSGDTELLAEIQGAIEEMLLPLGLPAESRRFHPHLTLGRIKDSKAVVQSRLPWGTIPEGMSFPVETVHFIQSQLLPSGAVYTTLHTSSMAS
jgi:2'-5' RNA ligase